MGILSLEAGNEQNQTNVTTDVNPTLLDNKQALDRSTVAAEITNLGELLCGNWTGFIKWYRFEWLPYFGTPMSELLLSQLSELHTQLVNIEKATRHNAALVLTVRNHYLALHIEASAKQISARSVKNPYDEKFFAAQSEAWSGGRTMDIKRLTNNELALWVHKIGAQPAVIESNYKSHTRRIIALHTRNVTYIDGSLALDPKVLPHLPNLTIISANAPSTSKIDTLTPVGSVSGIEISPDGETPVKVADFSPKYLMLASGRQNVLMLAAPQKAQFETMTAITAKAKSVCSGVVARVIEEKTAINILDKALTEADAQKALAWVVGLQTQLMQTAQLMHFKEQLADVHPAKVQRICNQVTQMRTSDYKKLTMAEANEVLQWLADVALPKVFDDKARRNMWLKILPLERELGVDAMVSRAKAGVPQTWTRGSEIELVAYLGKLQAQKANVALMSGKGGGSRRLGKVA